MIDDNKLLYIIYWLLQLLKQTMNQKYFLGCTMLLSMCVQIPDAFSLKDHNQFSYKHCQDFLSQCPKDDPVVNQSCQKKLEMNPICLDLSLLADQLQTDMASLQIQKIQQWFLVKQTYAADGQLDYFILTENKKITPITQWIDGLNKKNLIINKHAPIIQQKSHGLTSLLLDFEARPCVACAASDSYLVHLIIDSQGNCEKHKVITTQAPLA
jgi:hypothetical protein